MKFGHSSIRKHPVRRREEDPEEDNSTETPRGFTCRACKHFNRISLWVYAHWPIPVTGECELCGKKYIFKNGKCRGRV